MPPPSARTVSVAVDSGSVILPQFVDPNADPLQIRVIALPAAGTLHQYSEGGPGEPITAVGQVVADPAGRVFFVPRPQEWGLAYDSFSLAANDGEFDSTEAITTVNVVPVPVIDSDSVAVPPGGGITFTFAGLPDVTYYVQRSTDLVYWVNYTVTQPTPGQFLFLYQAAANDVRGFFRIRVP